MGKKKDDGAGDVPEFPPAQLKNVQTQLKKLEKNTLKLILGHDNVLHGYFDKVAKKNGLPAVFILGNLLSVVAHCLTPAKTAYRKTDDFTLIVHCINFILHIGESGTGKSPARNLINRAMKLAMKTMLQLEDELPADLIVRIRNLDTTCVFDASAGGMLEILKARAPRTAPRPPSAIRAWSPT